MVLGDMKMRVGFLSNSQFHVTPYPVTVHHVTQYHVTRPMAASGAGF